MRIGLDFDNTIVSYDSLFHKVALEQAVIPTDLPADKLAVRDYLRQIDQEDIWTQMQGYVYGARMTEAQAYPGAIEMIRKLSEAGHHLAIVSHKTKHSFMGPQYDLHSAARAWIEQHLCEDGISLIPESQIFFELTKEEKLSRIGLFACDVFIDDLPEILLAPTFPTGTRRLLFDPKNHHREKALPELEVLTSWLGLSGYLQ